MTTPLTQIAKLHTALDFSREEWTEKLPYIGYAFGSNEHCDKFILGVSDESVQVFPLEGITPAANYFDEDMYEKIVSEHQDDFSTFDHLYLVEYPANSELDQDTPGYIGKVSLAVAVDLVRDEIDPDGVFLRESSPGM